MARGKATTPQIPSEPPRSSVPWPHSGSLLKKGSGTSPHSVFERGIKRRSEPGPFFNRPPVCDRSPLKHEVRQVKEFFCSRARLLFNCRLIKGLRHEKSFFGYN